MDKTCQPCNNSTVINSQLKFMNAQKITNIISCVAYIMTRLIYYKYLPVLLTHYYTIFRNYPQFKGESYHSREIPFDISEILNFTS